MINAIQMKEDEKVDSVVHRKLEDKPRLDEEDEQSGAFWEENLVLSMRHNVQHVPEVSFGQFEFLQNLEGTEQRECTVGPLNIGLSQRPKAHFWKLISRRRTTQTRKKWAKWRLKEAGQSVHSAAAQIFHLGLRITLVGWAALQRSREKCVYR